MRMIVIVILLGIAFWQSALDWSETISEGYAFRLTSLGAALETHLPEFRAWIGTLAEDSAFHVLREAILSVPLAIYLGGAAWLLWLTRPRGRGRG